MTDTVRTYAVQEKGLKSGAIGFWASVGVGLASTAPAYSLAARSASWSSAVGGVEAPLIVILAFIPMFLCAWAIKEMNAVDPDCGTCSPGLGARSARAPGGSRAAGAPSPLTSWRWQATARSPGSTSSC